MSESHIRNAILKWLWLHRGFVFIHDSVGIYDPTRRVFRKNFNRFRIKGVSDILGIWRRKFLAIEVKTSAGRPSPEQLEFINQVNSLGGIAFIARSIHEVEEQLKERGEFP